MSPTCLGFHGVLIGFKESQSIGKIGKAVAPFYAPLGIEWKGGVALLTGFVAKVKHNPIQCNNNPVHKFCDRDIDSFQQNSAPLKKLGNIQRN